MLNIVSWTGVQLYRGSEAPRLIELSAIYRSAFSYLLVLASGRTIYTEHFSP
jgi:hypothetical protein